MEAQRNKSFPLKESAINDVATLKTDIANATLTIPEKSAGSLILETDASGTAIGAVLSQASRSIAFLSRTLSHSEQKQSSHGYSGSMESVSAWSQYIHLFPTLIINGPKSSVPYLLGRRALSILIVVVSLWQKISTTSCYNGRLRNLIQCHTIPQYNGQTERYNGVL